MKSMTGYGKGSANYEGRTLTVELKSVNHRYLDLSIRLPRAFLAYEDLFRQQLSLGLNRGHVDVYVNYEDCSNRPKKLNIDQGLAKSLVETSRQLQEQFDIKNDFNVNSLLKSQDVLTVMQEEDDPAIIKNLVTESVSAAATNLNKMREAEGEKLSVTLNGFVDNIEKLVDEISAYAPSVVEEYRNKLKARISEALADVALDESKLANEVCFFADKSNIDEELARLKSHIAQIRQIFKEKDQIGRKLDFLVQEFNREANTICSKSNNIALTNLALSLKNEIEKVREQIQNVE